MLASIDKSDGRVMVLDNGFGAVKEDGVWRPGVFTADDLKDNFERINDSTETARLVQEARAALSDTLSLDK